MKRMNWQNSSSGIRRIRELFGKFEEELIGRRYYPFFFQILDEKAQPVYSTREAFKRFGIHRMKRY